MIRVPIAAQPTMHLSPPDIEAALTECSFCRGTEFRPFAKLQDNPEIQLCRCTRCQALSASHIPNDDALRRYYASFTYPGSNPAKYTAHYYHSVKTFGLGKVDRILDFGGSDGALMLGLADRLIASGTVSGPIQIDIVDRTPRPKASPDNRIRIAYYDQISDISDGDFDFVLASAVLEHLKRPGDTFRQLLDKVRPGGLFYARTPCVAPFLRLPLQSVVNFDFTFPGHIHDLGQAFWDSVLRLPDIGDRFEILVSRPSPNESVFGKDPFRYLASAILKSPARLFRAYPFVGGWEVFCRRVGGADSRLSA